MATTVAVLVCAATSWASAAATYVEGELLVKFRDAGAAQFARDQLKHDVRRHFKFIGWQHIRLPGGLSVPDAITSYRKLPGVLEVERNEMAQGASVPNDPRFAEQYALAKVQATNAWSITTGSSNVVVALIDSGINYDHEDLAPNMWRNPGEIPGNGVDDDGNGFVDDIYGIDTADDFYGNDSDPRDFGNPSFYHGTASAGVIGSVANNGLGGAGLNWNVRLMALRAIRINNNASGADLLAAYDYVLLMKERGVNIKVLNMSYAGTSFSAAHRDALAQITARGILGVAAAHNQTNDNDVIPRYPAGYNGVVAVAATDQNDNLATFSNWGRTNVDLAAPGVSILMPGGPATNVYATGHGTSFACPHVSGAAALLFAAFPNATPEQVKAALLETVDLVPALTNRMASHGRLNIGRAVLHPSFYNAPLIVQPPLSQSVVAGGEISVSVAVSGSAPFGFQWFGGGTMLENIVQTNANCFLTLSNIQGSGPYSVVVTNAGSPVIGATAAFEIEALADGNGNGLPDVWELTFGVSNPGDDPDNDLLTNLQEYRAGTDPTNPASALRIRYIPPNTIEFTAASNKTYTVEHTPALAEPWQKMAEVAARSTNRIEQLADPAVPGTYRWYRVVTPRQP